MERTDYWFCSLPIAQLTITLYSITAAEGYVLLTGHCTPPLQVAEESYDVDVESSGSEKSRKDCWA